MKRFSPKLNKSGQNPLAHMVADDNGNYVRYTDACKALDDCGTRYVNYRNQVTAEMNSFRDTVNKQCKAIEALSERVLVANQLARGWRITSAIFAAMTLASLFVHMLMAGAF